MWSRGTCIAGGAEERVFGMRSLLPSHVEVLAKFTESGNTRFVGSVGRCASGERKALRFWSSHAHLSGDYCILLIKGPHL